MVITSGILKGRQVFVLEPNETPDEGCPFLGLPPEVRNMIYIELLVHKGGETFQVTGNQAKYIRCWGPTSLRLLRTCSQIYQEAAAIYYGLNNFSFTSTTTLMHYLQKIETSVRFLRSIEIQDLYGSTIFKTAKLLVGATSLMRLEIDYECSTVHHMSRGYDLTDRIAYVFKEMFQAIQKARNNREEVSNILTCKEFELKCYAHEIGLDAGECYCSNKRIWEEGVKAEILDYLPADRPVEAPAMATPNDDKLQPTDTVREPPATRSSARKNGKITNYFAASSDKRMVEVNFEDEDGDDGDLEEVESSSEAADSDDDFEDLTPATNPLRW